MLLRTSPILSILSLLVFALSPLVQAQSEDDEEQHVASWEDVHLSLVEFEAAYLMYWQSTEQPDSPALRKQAAREMLEQKLIALEGLKKRLNQHPVIQQKLRRDAKLFVRKRYLEEQVRAGIPQPTEDEIQIALERQNRRYYLRQLFSLTKEGIDSLQQRLDAGEEFAQIAKETLPDRAMAEAGGTLGWLGWGETDLPVEDKLYTLDYGDTSEPVQSLMGWHIFRVDSVEQYISFVQPDSSAYQDTKAKLFNRKLDIAAAHFIRDFVWAQELALDMRVARTIWQSLAPMLPANKDKIAPVLEELAETPPVPVANQIVATVNGQPFYARQFFDALPNLPKDYLTPNLKPAIEIAIRDSLLAEQGIKQNFLSDREVVGKLKRAETAYVFNAMMKAAIDSVNTNPVDLESFFEENKARYIKYIETEVWEVLVNNPDSARAIAKRIHGGLDFFSAAHSYTTRDSVRANNGYLGFIRSDENAIGKKAATLLPGALFAPIKTNDGYSVIRTGIRIPIYHKLAEIRDTVIQDARQTQFAKLFADLLPKTYRPQEVVINEALLQNAFQH